MDSGRLETVPSGPMHLDTVRTLHQTVVSLRTALELSKNELKELKEKYEQHSQCLEYADVIEKLTLENHILRRKIIDSGEVQNQVEPKSIKFEVAYSSLSQNTDHSDIVVKTASSFGSEVPTIETITDKEENFCSDKLNDIVEEVSELCEAHDERESVEIESSLIEQSNEEYLSPNNDTKIDEPESQITSCDNKHKAERNCPSSFKTKLELLSKFDVRIKVRSLKGQTQSNSTSDTDSSEEKKDLEKESTNTNTKYHFEEKKEHFESIEDTKGNKININTFSTEDIKMAVPNEMEAKNKVDKFDVQVKITSEENLTVQENVERCRRKDTLNLDVDDLSLRSMSEGDNSVFSEGVTPIDPMPPTENKQGQDDNCSGNESEEVDDIELIFTTDESKDMSNLQEDLVSIRETEHWTPHSMSTTTHSTPVLVKFHTLDPDFQPGGETKQKSETNIQWKNMQSTVTETSLRQKRVSLPSDRDIRNAAFESKGLEVPGRGILKSCDNKSDIMLYKKSPNISTRRLDSVDSLTADYKGLSFDNTKSSSFELGSSMDILHRDDSVDSFNRTSHLGHRFSVYAENDISKCGISEEDLSTNLNVRRNTCPNPFQYRPSAYRGFACPRGPLKAPSAWSGSRARPVLRDSVGPRRENGAQTDVCALPPRWTSDGYLAYKQMPVPSRGVLPTLPTRSPALARKPAVPCRPPPRTPATDETRRVLLSDIGFTSMVPELSRSADPVWVMGRRAPNDNELETTHAAKYISRSSFRSPHVSLERSDSEWAPVDRNTTNYTGLFRPWRNSLPDVRDDTEELLEEADAFLRRSIDDLHYTTTDSNRWETKNARGQPYIPAEPRHLRLGHDVKLITPHGRIAIGRVRYVGLAGCTAATSSIVVGAEIAIGENPVIPRNDGTHHGRRYFLTSPHHTAMFVPFSKVVMAWAN